MLWGLEGEHPETVDTGSGPIRAAEIKRSGQLRLAGTQPIAFDAEDDLILHRRRRLPFHPNGMTFTAYADGRSWPNAPTTPSAAASCWTTTAPASPR